MNPTPPSMVICPFVPSWLNFAVNVAVAPGVHVLKPQLFAFSVVVSVYAPAKLVVLPLHANAKAVRTKSLRNFMARSISRTMASLAELVARIDPSVAPHERAGDEGGLRAAV